MDELQILVSAIVEENSQQTMDAELARIIEALERANPIQLHVGLNQNSVAALQTELQNIVQNVQTAVRNAQQAAYAANGGAGNHALQIFDVADLQAQGRRYFDTVDNIVQQVQTAFQGMGRVNVENVFHDAEGDVQRFTAVITRTDGVIERLQFQLAELQDATTGFNANGFVQMNTVLSDRNVGSNLESTLNFLSGIEDSVARIISRVTDGSSRNLTPDLPQYQQFNDRVIQVSQTVEQLREQNGVLSQEHKRQIRSMVSDLSSYGRQLQQAAYAANDMREQTFGNRQTQMLSSLNTLIDRWRMAGVYTGEFAQRVDAARLTLQNATNQSGLDNYRHQLSLLAEDFKRIKIMMSANRGWNVEDQRTAIDTFNTNVQTAQLKVQNLRQTYSAFLSDPTLLGKWNRLFDSSKIISSQKELTNLNAEIRKFEQELIAAGKHGKLFWDELQANAKKMANWMILGGVLASVMRGVTGITDAVTELNTAMTELKKVTDETDAAYESFLDSAAKRAVEIGTTYADLVTATADFARLGYDIADAQKLAEVANIYTVVGDEIASVDTATSSIISSMKAFNIGVDDAITIVDKFNEVGNRFAISSGGIGDALTRSASSLAAANNTIDESIALIVAANNVIQDPDMVGTMWKTVSMRIRGAKTELEEAGLETDYMASSTARLRKQIAALTNVDGLGGFDIMEDEKTFKSTYDIILGISKVWKDISDIDQAALLELLAGKRQGNALSAALENFDDAIKVMRVSSDAEGSAMREHEKYLESIQAKQDQLQAQYQAFANAILDSGLMTLAYDVGTGLLGWLTDLVEVLGTLPSLVGIVTPFFKQMQAFVSVTDSKNWLGTGTGIQFGRAKQEFITEHDLALLTQYETRLRSFEEIALTDKQIIWNDTIAQGSDNLKTMVRCSDDVAAAVTRVRAAANATGQGFSIMGLASQGAAIGIQMLSGALNALLNMGIAWVGSMIITWLTDLINKEKEARQEAIAAGQAASESAQELRELSDAYMELSHAVEEGTGSEEDLEAAQESLIESLREHGVAVEDLTGDYKDLREAMAAAVAQGIATDVSLAVAGAQASKQEAVDDLVTFFGENQGFSVSGKGTSEALDYLQELGYTGISGGSSDSGAIYLPHSTTWDITQDKKTFEEMIANYRVVEDMMNATRKEFGSENPVFIALSDLYNTYDKALGATIDSINSTNLYVATEAIHKLGETANVETLEDFTEFRTQLIDTLISDESIDTSAGSTVEQVVDLALSENAQYEDLMEEYQKQEDAAEALAKKRSEIIAKLIAADEASGKTPNAESYQDKLQNLSEEELGVVHTAVIKEGAESWAEITTALKQYRAEQYKLNAHAETLRTSLSEMWSSEDFEDTREELEKLSMTVTGITPESIEELAAESDTLAEYLQEDGMSAQFLAKILQDVTDGKDGFALITEESLNLNKALDGMVSAFDEVTAAKARYDAAMEVPEKDEGFKSYTEAFESLNAQFQAGTVNSNEFWAAAEYIFGNEQLNEWGWGDGLDQIYQAMTQNKQVFADADSAGTGFLNKLYQMSQAGKLVNEEGEKLIEITKGINGEYAIDLAPENIAEIAKQMQLSEEAVLACFQALSMWGDINLYDMEEVTVQLQEMGLVADSTSGKVGNLDHIRAELEKLGKTDKDIHDITTNLEEIGGVELLSVTDDVDTLTESLLGLGMASETEAGISINHKSFADLMAKIGFTKEEAESLITMLSQVDGISFVNTNGEVQTLSDAMAYIATLTFEPVTNEVNSLSDALGVVDNTTTDNAVSELNEVEEAGNRAATAVGSVSTKMQELDGQRVTAYIDVIERNGGFHTYAKGTKDAPGGPALVGEDGMELQQSGNEARLVGVDGPEIVNVNKGDKIYTAKQTKKILSKSGKRVQGTIPAYKDGLNDYDGRLWGEINISKFKTGATGSHASAEAVKTFEELYKEHQHWLEMDQETTRDYLKWLDKAYQEAYANSEIDLDDYYKYQEEVYKGLQDLFTDYLADGEHYIDMLGEYDNSEMQILNYYRKLSDEVINELNAAMANGLTYSDDYVQTLQKKWIDYANAIRDILDEAEDAAKDAVDELVDYRVDMLKQDLENEKDSLEKRLDKLKDFCDKQKELMQMEYDQEDYLEERAEKRKEVSYIQADIERLKYDDSAWAQKRRLELEEELAEAQKELADFEKEKAREDAIESLDKMYEGQEAAIETEVEAIEEKLNDPQALYNQALSDIKSNTKGMYDAMLVYNRKYGDGNDDTVKEMWEESYLALENYKDAYGESYEGIELPNKTGYVSEKGLWEDSPIKGVSTDYEPDEPTGDKAQDIPEVSDDKSGGYKSIGSDRSASDISMNEFLDNIMDVKADDAIAEIANRKSGTVNNVYKNSDRIFNSRTNTYEVNNSGDIVIQGNTNEKTVSEIRRAQRENTKNILKELHVLNR